MMTHGFEKCDPATGEPLPKFMWMEFFAITYRARRILGNRSADEIRDICVVLNSISRASGFEDPMYDHMRNWAGIEVTGPNGKPMQAMPTASDAGELLHNINRVKLESLDNPPKARWHELFAVMALSMSDKATWTEAEPNSPYRESLNLPPRPQAEIESDIRQYAMAGLEAVAIAESILRQDKALELEFEKFNAKRQEIARQAAKAKGQETEKLAEELYEFWRSGNFKSPREAANLFVKEHPATKFIHLSNPAERLYKVLLAKIKERSDPEK